MTFVIADERDDVRHSGCSNYANGLSSFLPRSFVSFQRETDLAGSMNDCLVPDTRTQSIVFPSSHDVLERTLSRVFDGRLAIFIALHRDFFVTVSVSRRPADFASCPRVVLTRCVTDPVLD